VPVRNLDRLLRPKRVAVVGASEDPSGVGRPIFQNLIGSGYAGVVYAVNPRREAVLGVPAYPDLAALPHPPDLAIVCTPAATVPAIVRACGERGVPAVMVISAGFRETGPEGLALEKALLDERRRFPGMRILGPNCFGIVVPALRFNASFGVALPKSGRVAFLSQSGAICSSVLDWAVEEEVGLSTFLSLGNMIDVGFADLLDFLAADPDTDSVILYVESIPEARPFLSAARAFARSKPILAVKAGRFPESAKAAASHTGAMVAQDGVYDAVFRRAGIERAFEISDMFECAELLARPPRPRGARVAIVTNAGGPGVMATDALIAGGGTLAPLAPITLEILDTVLPKVWSRGNPVDVIGDAPPERIQAALETVLADPNVDAALAILTPQAMTDPSGAARAVAALKRGKPLLASWMGGRSVREGIAILNRAGIPTFATPEKAVGAFLHLHSYAKNLEILYETPREIPFTLPPDRARPLTATADLERLLRAYGIPVLETQIAASPRDAVQAAQAVGYPVVMKILSPDIPHKTDVGGVILDLKRDFEVREAYEALLANVARAAPGARLDGVTISRMVSRPGAHEMILGVKKDPVFGSVLLVGTGGVAAEVFRDTALALPPLNEALARRALESLRSWPLLRGWRGRPGADLDRLIEVLLRFSWMVAEHGEIAEMDLNPLLVAPEEIVALDARVTLDPPPERPFAHLAIRPYPREWEGSARLKDGSELLVRPIRPEDEPLWHAMLRRCSPESIRFRWRYLFADSTHEMASRYCYIDYDREMALVAEAEGALVANARLVADADMETGDYAVIVEDRWQGRGLGSVLTDRMLEVARLWGLRRVTAETTPDNGAMVNVFWRRGFRLDRREDAVLAVKELGT